MVSGMVRSIYVLGAIAAAVAANAQVTFNNVVIAGSLSAGASFNTGATFIDFLLPNAKVGDTETVRSGDVTITYNAVSGPSMIADDILLSILGALSGAGEVFFNEVVEDMSDPNNPTIIATHNAHLTDNNQFPYTFHMVFEHPADTIRVKKTLFLAAPDSQAFDFAGVSLVQQSISLVPEPGTIIALGIGAAALARRRKK